MHQPIPLFISLFIPPYLPIFRSLFFLILYLSPSLYSIWSYISYIFISIYQLYHYSYLIFFNLSPSIPYAALALLLISLFFQLLSPVFSSFHHQSLYLYSLRGLSVLLPSPPAASTSPPLCLRLLLILAKGQALLTGGGPVVPWMEMETISVKAVTGWFEFCRWWNREMRRETWPVGDLDWAPVHFKCWIIFKSSLLFPPINFPSLLWTYAYLSPGTRWWPSGDLHVQLHSLQTLFIFSKLGQCRDDPVRWAQRWQAGCFHTGRWSYHAYLQHLLLCLSSFNV